MTLTNCYACGGQVHGQAKACPHCGADKPGDERAAKWEGRGMKMQKVGCLLTLVITVPLLVGMCFFAGLG